MGGRRGEQRGSVASCAQERKPGSHRERQGPREWTFSWDLTEGGVLKTRKFLRSSWGKMEIRDIFQPYCQFERARHLFDFAFSLESIAAASLLVTLERRKGERELKKEERRGEGERGSGTTMGPLHNAGCHQCLKDNPSWSPQGLLPRVPSHLPRLYVGHSESQILTTGKSRGPRASWGGDAPG